MVEKKATVADKTVTTDEPIYAVALDNNLVALGTEDYIHKSIDILGKKEDSILTNKEMISLIGDKDHSDMLWIAAIIPEGFTAPATPTIADNDTASKIPNVKNGILALNYKDKAFAITGKINCKTPQDVKKIMTPVNMLLGILSMNPDSGIKTQDIILKQNGSLLNVNITLPEKTLDSIMQTTQNPQTPPVPGLPVSR